VDAPQGRWQQLQLQLQGAQQLLQAGDAVEGAGFIIIMLLGARPEHMHRHVAATIRQHHSSVTMQLTQ
jgi:hypothetical protein